MTARLGRVIDLAQTSAVLAMTEHPDLGTGEMARSFRTGYRNLATAYMRSSEKYKRDWFVPTFEEREPTRDEFKFQLDTWFKEDVPTVRAALAAHMELADRLVAEHRPRPERRAVNQLLFLVGAETQLIYIVLNHFNGATRARRRAWKTT